MTALRRPAPAFLRESLRIAGRKVDGEGAIDVFNPYTNEVVGTVPRARRDQVAEAFQIAAGYKPKLTRYDRQKILMTTAELLAKRKDALSDLITAESGLCKKDSLYEVGRAYDVFHLSGQLAIRTTPRPSPATSPRTARRAASSRCASRSAPSARSRPSTIR